MSAETIHFTNMKLLSFIFIITLSSCINNDSYKFPDGGYEIPKHVDDKDINFPCYPIKNLLDPRDSMDRAFFGYRILTAFNEPNISITPSEKPIFRFIYNDYKGCFIITLNPGNIIVKNGNLGNYMKYDDSILTELENLHYGILLYDFPITKANMENKSKAKQHRLDSLIKIYPQLLDPKYYRYLLDKYYVLNKVPFIFIENKISISTFQYRKLIKLINESGYWKMPIRNHCSNPPSDGFEFILEANTGLKYNFVQSGMCLDNSTNFTKACQELIKYAKVDKKIWVDLNERNNNKNK